MLHATRAMNLFAYSAVLPLALANIFFSFCVHALCVAGTCIFFGCGARFAAHCQCHRGGGHWRSHGQQLFVFFFFFLLSCWLIGCVQTLSSAPPSTNGGTTVVATTVAATGGPTPAPLCPALQCVNGRLLSTPFCRCQCDNNWLGERCDKPALPCLWNSCAPCVRSGDSCPVCPLEAPIR